MKKVLFYIFLFSIVNCNEGIKGGKTAATNGIPESQFTISAEENHNKFSSTISYQLKVPDGSVVEAFTTEATGGQLNVNSSLKDFEELDMDKVHT